MKITLTDEEKSHLTAFLIRQFGFDIDEIDLLFDTDEKRLLAYAAGKKLTLLSDDIDVNDAEFDGEFGESYADTYELSHHERAEMEFYSNEVTESEKMKAERKKKLREALDDMLAPPKPVESSIPEAESGSDSPVTDEEIQSALDALRDDVDDSEDSEL